MRAFGKRPLILNMQNNDSFIGIVRDKIHSALNGGVEEKKKLLAENRKEYEDFKKGILSSLKKTYSSFTHL